MARSIFHLLVVVAASSASNPGRPDVTPHFLRYVIDTTWDGQPVGDIRYSSPSRKAGNNGNFRLISNGTWIASTQSGPRFCANICGRCQRRLASDDGGTLFQQPRFFRRTGSDSFRFFPTEASRKFSLKSGDLQRDVPRAPLVLPLEIRSGGGVSPERRREVLPARTVP